MNVKLPANVTKVRFTIAGEQKWTIELSQTMEFLGAFPDDSVVKNLPAHAGDSGSIPGSGRSPGVGNGNPLQYSCLKNSMDREAWQATVYGVTKSCTQLSD